MNAIALHTITATTTATGLDVDWTHPADCTLGDACPFVVRAASLRDWDMVALVDGRPDGTYRLGLFGFRGLCLLGEDGLLLPDVAPAAA